MLPRDAFAQRTDSPPAYVDEDGNSVPAYSSGKDNNVPGFACGRPVKTYGLYVQNIVQSGHASSHTASARASSSSAPLSSTWKNESNAQWNGTEIHVWQREERQLQYSIRIPIKRDGWKAEVSGLEAKRHKRGPIDEKRSVQHPSPCLVPRYEVRRELLARRIDFRHQPDGTHNVMVPSARPAMGAPRTYSFETADGQELEWQRSGIDSPKAAPFRTSWTLRSQPSMTVVARYDASNSRHQQEEYETRASGESGSLHGVLLVATFEAYEGFTPEDALFSPPVRRVSSTSSSSSEDRARLARTHKRPLGMGIAVPAILSASVGSPLSTAAWNRNCVLGDDLANLGRTDVGKLEPVSRADALWGDAPSRSGPSDATERLAALNRSESVKHKDPRPRNVELDLIIASLIAVLDA